MKAVVQRVKYSSVEVSGEIVGQINQGLNILIGVQAGDSEREAELLAGKIARLRIFKDDENKMNLSVVDVGGAALVISQFTLCADIKKGNRPSFDSSAEPKIAKKLYEYFTEKLKENGVINTQNGIFAAEMTVEIINDGPVTIMLDTDIWSQK